MYEYVVIAFKVIVGVITNERLALAACVAVGLMLIWIIFSLIFSYQGKFASRVRKINDFVSRNGFSLEARQELKPLVAKMPSEFQRGYKAYEKEPNSMPSKHIKRFESLDLDLMSGVFNQNKSVLKTYTNFVFVSLLLLSVAIIAQEDALTGYLIAEASIIPLAFLFVAKIIYYAYTAIRQYQYRNAVEEFNEMLDNMDKWVEDNLNSGIENVVYKPESQETIQMEEPENNVNPENIVEEVVAQNSQMQDDKTEDSYTQVVVDEGVQKLDAEESVANNIEYSESVEGAGAVLELDELSEAEIDAIIKDVLKKDKLLSEENQTQENDSETIEENKIEDKKQEEEILKEVTETKKEKKMDNKDNFKPDFASLLEEEAAPKRKRGRPKKEVSESGELVIKNDKEFEDALLRAEKLMRKNEEPLSASQTKRIEKQIKELVDAMNKYKEGK